MKRLVSQLPGCRALQRAIRCVAVVGFLILAGPGSASGADQETILRKTAITPSPKVENGRITYQMDLTFNKAPVDFLTYYEPKKSAIILDIYGTDITRETGMLPRNLIFKSLRVENVSSNMSLSGKKSQIILGADPGWQISTAAQSDTVLTISVSRILSSQAAQSKIFPSHRVIFGVANALAVAVSAVVIFLLPQAPR